MIQTQARSYETNITILGPKSEQTIACKIKLNGVEPV